MKTALFADGL
jgi:hypothetical protein